MQRGQPLLDSNLGFDSMFVDMRHVQQAAVGKLMDGMGTDVMREVTVDEIKNRFFTLGLQVGVAFQMFLMSIIIMVTAEDDDDSGAIYELVKIYYPLFRGLFLICFFFVCYGVNLFVWKRAEVDYRAILGVTHNHNYHCLMRASFLIMSVVFASFAMYVLTVRSPHTRYLPNKHVWPAAALIGTVLLVLWPWDLMPEWSDRSQRYGLLRQLARLMVSPAFPVSFAATFVADVLTSMPKIFSDFLFTACVYANGSALQVGWDADRGKLRHSSRISQCSDERQSYFVAHFFLAILPFWIRLMQCARAYRDSWANGYERRHLFNASKYVCSLAVVVLSFFSSKVIASAGRIGRKNSRKNYLQKSS